MPLPLCFATTVYFLRFSVSVTVNTFTVLYQFYPLFVAFSVAFHICGLLWTISFTVHQFHCNNTSHICYIFYNRHIYNISSIISYSVMCLHHHNNPFYLPLVSYFTNIPLLIVTTFVCLKYSLSQHLPSILYFALLPFH